MGADQTPPLSGLPLRAVKAYGEFEFARLDRKLAIFRSLPVEERDLLPEFEQRITSIADCIDVNAKLLSHMAKSSAPIQQGSSRRSIDSSPVASENDVKTTRTTTPTSPSLDLGATDEADEQRLLSREARRGLTLLARDWSVGGLDERTRVYMPLVNAVCAAFEEARRAARALQPGGFRVLVPGAGAGRLAWEIAKNGFVVEGCERSFTALLVANYVLNSMSVDDQVEVFPYAHAHSNVRSKSCSLRGVQVPDVNPKDIAGSTDFSMRAGEFTDVYEGQDNCWDAVVGLLAFDVSEGCVEHVRRVAQILKPGGIWAFVGPAPCVEEAQADCVHISVEEFAGMVRKSGFKIIKYEKMTCLHSADPESMRIVRVECPFVVAVKVRPVV